MISLVLLKNVETSFPNFRQIKTFGDALTPGLRKTRGFFVFFLKKNFFWGFSKRNKILFFF